MADTLLVNPVTLARAARSRVAILALACLALPMAAQGCGRPDPQARIAVASAFAPEWVALKAIVQHPRVCRINGTEFISGTIEGHKVVVFMSGISMVNAAMNTQRVFDHYHITRMVVSGVAGGADPALGVGDVTVPERWGEYLEGGYGREGAAGYEPPIFRHGASFPGFGMFFPGNIVVSSTAHPEMPRFWFEADATMLDVARQAADATRLSHCTDGGQCLDRTPRVLVGGAGVSGPVFVDNARFREYAFSTFGARVLDMETAAMAHVAWSNDKPFIAFRSLSDLAGGGAGANQIRTFMGLAASNSTELVRQFLKRLPRDRAIR